MEWVVKSSASNTNRMVSPDTIVADPNNPQSYNRYSYVFNNPVNFSDPSGNIPCAGWEGSQCVDGNQMSFDEYSHWVWVDSLGVLDTNHINRGFNGGQRALELVEKVYSGQQSSVVLEDDHYGFSIAYAFSGEMSYDQIPHYAASIALDFEFRFEQFQTDLGVPKSWSGYSIEDLPSDYIGIWAATNGIPRDGIFPLLEFHHGEAESMAPSHYLIVAPIIDSSGKVHFNLPANNKEFLPVLPHPNMPLESAPWVANPWPEYLRMDHTTFR